MNEDPATISLPMNAPRFSPLRHAWPACVGKSLPLSAVTRGADVTYPRFVEEQLDGVHREIGVEAPGTAVPP